MTSHQSSGPGQQAGEKAGDDDASIASLLRAVGPREEFSADVANSVRAVVYAEWQAMVRARSVRRKWVGLGAAASVIVVTVAVLFSLLGGDATVNKGTRELSPIAELLTVQSNANHALVQASRNGGNAWHDLAVGEKLVAGEILRTDSMTRVALGFGNDLSIRVDADSNLRIAAIHEVQLDSGRVYIDAVPNKYAPMKVRTKYGELQHLGTQYQAEVTDKSLIVSVREGFVEYSGTAVRGGANAGERVEFDLGKELSREAIGVRDPGWQWIAQVTPTYDIENKTLSSFLVWAGRETGRTVVYSTADVRAQAEKLVLRGSIKSLSADQALRAVLATTPFTLKATADAIEIAP